MATVLTRKRGKTWEYRFEIASVGGKRRHTSKGGFRTKKEALQAGTAAMAEYNATGLTFTPSEISVHDYLLEWHEQNKIKWSENTVGFYKRLMHRHILPELGDQRVSGLTPAMLQSFVTAKRDAYSKDYVGVIVAILHSALKYAVYPLQYIKENPMTYVTIPDKRDDKPQQPRIVNYQEYQDILSMLSDSPYRHAVVIGYHTGARIGEVLALDWTSIDFDTDTIKIDKTLYRPNDRGGLTIGPPKTIKSIREIKIDPYLVTYLKDLKRQQLENRLEYGEHYLLQYVENKDTSGPRDIISTTHAYAPSKETHSPIDFVCKQIHGKALSPIGFGYWCTKIQANLNKDFTFHSLRHTHATLLAQSGVALPAIQARLGHATLDQTLGTYAHATDTMEKDIIDTLTATVST